MERQIKNKAELRAMIRAEQEKWTECKGACFGDICWHAPDADGCNWKLSTMEGGDSAACVEKILPFTLSLRERYNIPGESR